MNLIVDDRERGFKDHLDNFSKKFNISYEIKRIDVGDYIFTVNNKIKLVIERKTWEDLSSSMRDGRRYNVKKLIDLREKCGCNVYYLIEGDASPPYEKKYSRIYHKNLLAHLDHLMMRDNINIIYSRNDDKEYSIYRIFSLIKNFLSIKNHYSTNEYSEIISIKIIGGDEESDNSESENKIIEQAPNEDILPINTHQKKRVVKDKFAEELKINETEIKTLDKNISLEDETILLKKNVVDSSNSQYKKYQIRILRCIPGIGSIIAGTLISNNIFLTNLLNDYNSQEISNLKIEGSDKCIGFKKSASIYSAISEINNLSSTKSKRINIRMFSEIPGISVDTAKILISNGVHVKYIIENSSNEIEEKLQKISIGKIKFRNSSIKNLLLYMKGI
jgi:ERCC4-type nuclease